MSATSAPWAVVTSDRGRWVTVACPYCQRQHDHEVIQRGRTEWRAPLCGLIRTPDQRATGYRFTTSTTN